MKQRFTKLLAAVALLVFMMPSMAGWGQTYTELFTIESSSVVSGTSYKAHTATIDNRNWVITFGGNNKSVGTNSNNRTNCNLSNYTKYAVSPVTTSSVASAFACGTSLSNIGKVSYTFSGGKNQTATNVYLLYSSDNNTFSQISLTAGTQGATIASGTGYEFTNTTGYFALLFVATNNSGDWRIDDVTITFFEESGTAYTITAQSNNTAYGSVSLSGSVITGTPADGCRYANPAYTVDPANSATVVQDGNEFTVTPSANTTVTINFEPIPTHTATFSVNGTTTTQSFAEGATITFPTAPGSINGKVFVGWTATPIEGTTTNAPEMVNSATMGTNDVTFYAVFADETPGTTQNASNTITPNTENIPESYGTANTFSKYSLNGVNFMIQQMYKSGAKLQWRAAGNTSGTGTMYNSDAMLHIQSVVLTYDESDANKNFTLSVGDAANPTDGTTITPTANGLVYTFDCSSYNKNYFVLTNGIGAGYLSQIVINYLTGAPSTYSNYCTTVELPAVEMPIISIAQNPFEFSTSVTITCATDGATIYYTTDGNAPTANSNVYSESFTINSTTTIKAMAIKGSDESTIAEVTAIKELATPTVEISSLNIDLNGTATVTTDGPALTLTTSDASVASVSGTTITGVAAGTATITATWSANNDYSGGTKDFTVVVTDPNAGAGTILFGNQGTNINSASVTGTDSNGNTWTITTEGTTSFTQNTYYSQVGKSDLPATSITFTTTLPQMVKITGFSAGFGGFNGTAGDVTLKVGETTVGTGSLNGSNDVTVSNTAEATGTVLTVTVTNIDKGVKCYNISYSYKRIPFVSINGHGGNAGNWYLIASPLTQNTDPTAINGLVASNGLYDLYRFNQNPTVTNENDYLEWENYKIHTNDFVLENGKGYLYASQASTTLYFNGECNTGATKTVNLDYSETNPDVNMRGWNLVGNPFTTEAYADHSYFVMDGNGANIVAEPVSSSTAINPFTGVFVQATATDQSVIFSKTAPSTTNNNGVVNLALSQQVNRGSAMVDKAVVSFNEGDQLGKFVFMESAAKLYIPQNGKDYAIVSSEAQGEMPVNFKAEENGTYTLSINTENVEMNYLHLIDNMTGMDVDLLQTPSYTFDATTNDYTSRFRLVFSANNVDVPSTGSGTFAFYSNGNWVVDNEGEATLQVIDINGRIVSNETINGSVATSIVATPGVYMLRLVNGNEVKTQKIVVR